MSNNENLRVPTSEEARKNGRKGGLASAEARKRKKQLKDFCNVILDNKITDDRMVDNLRDKFPELEIDDVTYGLILVLKQYEKAKDGDAKAFELLRDTSGQRPIEQQEIGFLNSDRIEIRLDGEEVE